MHENVFATLQFEMNEVLVMKSKELEGILLY